MEGSDLPEADHEYRLAQYLQARFDAPAYIRRAQQVQEALAALLGRCRKQRQQWLKEGKWVLQDLAAIASSWDDLSSWLPDGTDPDSFPRLAQTLEAQVVFRPGPASTRKLLRALTRLAEWLEAFNRRWHSFLLKLDLHPLNNLRDSYNRYYVLEKECALRSARLARLGFQPLEPLTVDELLRHFPLLPKLGLVGQHAG